MSRKSEKELNGSPRATGTTMIGLVLAAPIAMVVSVGVYYALGGHWGTPEQRGMVAGGVLFALMLWLNWQFGLRPMKALMEGVEELGRSNFRFRFNVEKEDEFGHIGRQFNRVLEALGRTEAEVASLKGALRWWEEREERGGGEGAAPVEMVQAAMQRFSKETDPDLLAESAAHIFFKDLRAERCLLVVCHEATNILSLEVVGLERGQRISEKIHAITFPRSGEELMALSGWPVWERVRQWAAEPSLDVLGQAVEAGGAFLGYVAVFREIRWRFSDNDRALFGALVRNLGAALQNLRLHERSVTDGLTGLYTRRLMEEVLEREFAKAKGAGLPLSALMVDVNNFKRVNDELGHAAGDAVLQRIAKCVKGSVRSVDYPCRYGGDEFLVLLVGTNVEGALRVGKRILAEVASSEGLPRLPDGEELSVSIGVACFPVHATTKAELMSLADKAMYEAKREGGNALKEAGKGTDKE